MSIKGLNKDRVAQDRNAPILSAAAQWNISWDRTMERPYYGSGLGVEGCHPLGGLGNKQPISNDNGGRFEGHAFPGQLGCPGQAELPYVPTGDLVLHAVSESSVIARIGEPLARAICFP